MELGNKDVLETIEKSLFVVVLDDELPTDDSDCCWKLMCGNPSNRYISWSFVRRQIVVVKKYAKKYVKKFVEILVFMPSSVIWVKLLING